MSNKFGLFVHWGIYALVGQHEQCFALYSIDRKEYEALMHEFNPVNFDPEDWVLMAKKAGMEYVCLTAKHHDGFCMWDTKYTDFNIMNTPYGKDVVKMLADACHKHGMKFSIYYSNPDWHHPDAYNPKSTHQDASYVKDNGDLSSYKQYIKDQITELMTNYGEIYTLFWDIPPQLNDPSINALVRELQPNILINDRGFDGGDFTTPEREFDGAVENSRFEKMTESCNSVGERAWGYRFNEDFYSLRLLTLNIDKVMAMGGSYLLNVGPKADGTIDPAYRAMIEKVGDWYNRMEGVLVDHETDYTDYDVTKKVIVTKKNGKHYFHFYNGMGSTGVFIRNYPNPPKSVVLLNNKQPMKWEVRKLHKCVKNDPPVPVYAQPETIHIYDIPVDEFSNEAIVLEIEW